MSFGLSDRAVIGNDLAMKCADDVEDAIHRNFALQLTTNGCALCAIAGASSAMAVAAGTLRALSDGATTAEAIDGLWLTAIRPLTLSLIGDRTDLAKLLAELEAKDA